MAALITLKEVYYNVESNNRPLLANISFSIGKDRITTIIGPNGAGKTTLLRLILGVLQPSSGVITQQSDLKIAYVPQRIQLNSLVPLTVKRFMALSSARGTSKTMIHDALKRVGLCHLIDQSMGSLSGGERQRVMLARAIMRQADLLVLDEPDQGLDVISIGEFYALLNSIRQEKNCSVLIVSHDLHWVMAGSDYVVCLNGHICCSGVPQAVANDPSYKELFGSMQPSPVGVVPYIHHHDHSHDGGTCPHG